jgi:hypothetical protein
MSDSHFTTLPPSDKPAKASPQGRSIVASM